jgi:hypothetical protein
MAISHPKALLVRENKMGLISGEEIIKANRGGTGTPASSRLPASGTMV